jgi:hypothetical protein
LHIKIFCAFDVDQTYFVYQGNLLRPDPFLLLGSSPMAAHHPIRIFASGSAKVCLGRGAGSPLIVTCALATFAPSPKPN